MNALISPDRLRNDSKPMSGSSLHSITLKTRCRCHEFLTGAVSCLAAIADAIRAKLNPNPANISEVMADIGALLDLSITGVSMPKGEKLLDLSKIDFDALRNKFSQAKHKNTDLEVLKAAVRVQLERLVRLNKTRIFGSVTSRHILSNWHRISLC